MKQKIIYLVLVVLVFGAVQAQDTVRYGDSNYYHMPHDSIIVIRSISHNALFGSYGHNYIEYTAGEPLTIYGIAILSYYKPHFIEHNGARGSMMRVDTTAANVDLYAMLLIKEGGHYYHVDSARWRPFSPNKYFEFDQNHFTFHERGFDTVVPVYEFYFSMPRVVVDTFYVGIFSTFANFDSQGNRVGYINGYNGSDGGEVGKNWPLFLLAIDSGGCSALEEQFCKAGRLQDGVVEIVDTSYYRLDGWPRVIGGAFPIIVPPDTDSFECPRVENFRLTGYVDGHPKFGWDAQAGQGPFQIAYGPADQPVDSHRVAPAMKQPYVLPDGGLDSTVLYVARCRGRCHHTCPLHDTIFWSEWSDAVEFWTGSRRPGSEGIVSPDDAVAFTLSPNPARDEVTLTVGSTVTSPCVVVIRDEQGRELLRQRMEGGEVTLSTRGLPAGLYLTTLESPQGSSTQKLVVER